MAKQVWKYIAAAAALLLMAGCAAKPPAATVVGSEPTETAMAVPSAEVTAGLVAEETPTPTLEPAPTPAPAQDEEATYYAYLRDSLLPSMGSVAPGNYPAEPVGEYGTELALDGVCSAAVADVDGDGSKELVLAYFASSENEGAQSTVTNLRLCAYRMENGKPVPFADFDPFLTQEDLDEYDTPYLAATGTFSGQELFLQQQGGKTYLVAIDRYAVDDFDTVYRMFTFDADGQKLAADYYFGGHEGLFLVKDGEMLAGYSYMGEDLPDGADVMEDEAGVEAVLDKELAQYGAGSRRGNLEIFKSGAPTNDMPPGRTNMTIIQGWGGDDPPNSYGPIDFELYDLTAMQSRIAA